MNNLIKGIASAMIVILIVLLIWIFLAYYRSSIFVDAIVFSSGDSNVSTQNIPSGEYVSEAKKDIESGLIESIIKDKDSKANTSGDTKNSLEIDDKKEPVDEEIKNTPDIIIELPAQKEENQNEQIMISSNSETSNQEKQEILSEIDEALQGLLEAVRKVETVDEDRLDATLDSEVGEQ